MPRQTNIQIRRGTAAAWASLNPTLAAGEIAMESDTRKIKIGNGSTAWNALQYVRFDGGDIDSHAPTTTVAPTTTTTAAPTTTTTTAAPTTSIAAMNVGAWGDPHMYVRKAQTLNPNDYRRGVFLAKWDDNKSGASGLNEIRFIDLQTTTDTVKIFYTNKAYNTAKVVSSVRVELNGNSTNYTTANTSTVTVTVGPIIMRIVRVGTGSGAYLIFEAKWDAINNVVKFKGALTAILKRMASSKTAYVGQAGLTFDGFGSAGQPYGLSRASFETNGVGMLSDEAETLNTGDDLTDALDFNTETSIGEGLDVNGQTVDVWDDIAAADIQRYRDGIVQPELPEYATNAVMLTSGSSYTVPAGANSMKVWAVGAGGSVRTNGLYAGAGGVAYRTYSVTPGSTINYTVNQTISGTSDTGGSNTTVTYDGITIRGYGGEPPRGITWPLLGNASVGLGGTFGGAADGGMAGGTGRDYGGYENGGSSGAVGRGGNGLDEWLGPQTGTPNNCKRITAADVSELFAALALANVNTTESCGSAAAFGSSAFNAKFGPYKAAGIGGGGISTPGYGDINPNGSGAVVIKFMGNSVSNPKPSYTPTAALLTSGAVNGVLANIDGGFYGILSNFQQYTVPSGATSVKAWAVGGGGYPNAGGVAYAEWMVYSGQIIYYRIGSYGQPSYVIGGHRELPTNEAANAKKLLIGNGGRIIQGVSGAGSRGGYSGGDGGANGSETTNYGENDWGGAIGGTVSHVVNQRNPPTDVSGLLAAVALAGGSANFGAGGFNYKYSLDLAPGIGGGSRNSNGSQGCVVLYFT